MRRTLSPFLFITSLAFGGVLHAAEKEPIQPITAAKVANPAMVELGKKLFFDPRLSRSGFISCNSCHNLSMGGTDNIKTSIGHNWQRGPINSPTVLNASMNVAQILGWPRQGFAGAGGRSHRQSRRNGFYARAGHRRAGLDSRLPQGISSRCLARIN